MQTKALLAALLLVALGSIESRTHAAFILTAGGRAVSTVTCAQSTPNIPDGPDLLGGCFPGPNNTGPNAAEGTMSTYAGSCHITTSNVTIDSKVVNCDPLQVGSGATGLLITNSYLHGGVIQDDSTSASFTIRDSIIDNNRSWPACTAPSSCSAGLYACGDINNATEDCGVGYRNFTLLRVEIMHANRSAYCESTCTIQDSYMHGTNLWPDHTNMVHASGVRNEQFLTLTHNSLACDFTAPGNLDPGTINGEIGCSAPMTGYADFAPVKNDTIQDNLFIANVVGAAYCAYGGNSPGKPFSNDSTNATNIQFLNNVFQRGSNNKCAAFGHILDFAPARSGNVWSGNKWDDGTTAPSS